MLKSQRESTPSSRYRCRLELFLHRQRESGPFVVCKLVDVFWTVLTRHPASTSSSVLLGREQ